MEVTRAGLKTDRNDAGEMAGVMILKKRWKEMLMWA